MATKRDQNNVLRQGEGTTDGGKYAAEKLGEQEKTIPGPPLNGPQLAAAADTTTAAFFEAENRRFELLREYAKPQTAVVAHELKTRYPDATHFDISENYEDGERWTDGIIVLKVTGDEIITLDTIIEGDDEDQDLIDCAKNIGDDQDAGSVASFLETVPDGHHRSAHSIAAATTIPLDVAEQESARISPELYAAANTAYELKEVARTYIAADLATSIMAEYPTATHVEPEVEMDDDGDYGVAGYSVVRMNSDETFTVLESVADFEVEDDSPQRRLVDHVKTLGTGWENSEALNSLKEQTRPDNPYSPWRKLISFEKALAAHQ